VALALVPAAVVLVGLSVALPEATAQQAGADIPPERIAQSRKYMEEGQSLYAQRRYADAAAAFQKAYLAQPFPAFLFNEGVCHEKLGDTERAIETFKRYVTTDPNAPDADAVKARIKRLEAERAAKAPPPDAGAGADAGASATVSPPPDTGKPQEGMRSLVLVESDPPGAPAQLWQKLEPGASMFQTGGENKGWRRVSQGLTPLAVTAAAGQFHVVVDKWRTYNRSESDIEVYPGRVHQVKLNLSQGDFMAFLRVTTEVDDASIYLDDPPPHDKQAWGTAPHGALVPRGKHTIWIEAPGYETKEQSLTLEAGQQKELSVSLERVSYGFLLFDGNAAAIKVSLDGEPRGVVQSEDGPLRVKAEAGKHVVLAEAQGKKPYRAEVAVPAGQERKVHLIFFDKPSRALGVGATIGSVAALGAGIFLGLRSNGLHDELARDRAAGVLTADDPRVNHGKLYAYGANGGLLLGGLLAGVAVYGFVRDPFPATDARVDEPEELREGRGKRRESLRPAAPRFAITPDFGPSAGGVTLSGAF
jgi:hypothetical protein